MVDDKVTPVGLGISAVDATQTISLNESETQEERAAPETKIDEVRPNGQAPINGDHGDVETTASTSSAPPPPPKSPSTSPRLSTDKPLPPMSRPLRRQQEDEESLQDVELSRKGTPQKGPIPNRAPSITSLPSPSPSGLVSPSSRPNSTRPQSRNASGAGGHSRRSSTATTLSLSGIPNGGPGPQLSTVLIMPPLQVLVQSKEAKKSASFLAAAQKALDLCQAGGDGSNAAYLHPREIFEPLRLAISNPQTTSVPILITSLDLLSKLISHSFFSEPNGPPKGQSPLPDLITHTITLSWTENSPPQVALQVVKALMAIVLSTDRGMLVHQSSLLKAIRSVYNVFLLSNDVGNQVVAQGGLTQMVHHVFGRVIRPDPRAVGMSNGSRGSVGENEARREAESGPPTPAPATPGPESNGDRLTLWVLGLGHPIGC